MYICGVMLLIFLKIKKSVVPVVRESEIYKTECRFVCSKRRKAVISMQTHFYFPLQTQNQWISTYQRHKVAAVVPQ